MTYTFKLARRLAVSRHFSMLPALLLFVACSGEDTTSPGSPPDPTSAVAVRITPRKVILATDQPIRFLARGLTSAGDSVGATVAWRTTGGTILPDGRFSAGAVGTFRVMGTNRTGDEVQVDTAIVIVVRRQPHLTKVEVRPGSVSLTPGDSLNFTAIGRTILDRVVPIGVKWRATGGTIDAGGTYVAGDSLGSYRVVAVNMGGTVTDTATVVIDPAPVAPLPPDTLPSDTLPPAPEPPQPVLGEIRLIPSTVTLAPATTRQFKAYGRTTDGDSVAVSVVFASTGGTVTAEGLYTAGSTAGTYRIIATTGVLADTSTLTVTQPLGSGPAAGIPFGPFGGWDGAVLKTNSENFTSTMGSVSASVLIDRINVARSRGIKLLLAMTGGSHSNYLTNGVFDMVKWRAKMDTYNTPAIKTAVAAAVADGTILGNIVMDEPHVHGLGDGNTWGPVGTMTKARVDSLCGYAKQILPTLPIGVTHQTDAFEPAESYRVCEFLITQYATRAGDVTAFRDRALAMGRRDRMAIVFSMNILNGSIQAQRDGLWNCSPTTTGGRGTYEPNCRMTAQQVLDVGRVLGPAGCGLMMWRYDDVFMARPENQQAFRALGDLLRTLPGRSCSRP